MRHWLPTPRSPLAPYRHWSDLNLRSMHSCLVAPGRQGKNYILPTGFENHGMQ